MTLDCLKLVSLPFILLCLSLISVCNDRVEGSLELNDVNKNSVYFKKFIYDFVNMFLNFSLVWLDILIHIIYGLLEDIYIYIYLMVIKIFFYGNLYFFIII